MNIITLMSVMYIAVAHCDAADYEANVAKMLTYYTTERQLNLLQTFASATSKDLGKAASSNNPFAALTEKSYDVLNRIIIEIFVFGRGLVAVDALPNKYSSKHMQYLPDASLNQICLIIVRYMNKDFRARFAKAITAYAKTLTAAQRVASGLDNLTDEKIDGLIAEILVCMIKDDANVFQSNATKYKATSVIVPEVSRKR